MAAHPRASGIGCGRNLGARATIISDTRSRERAAAILLVVEAQSEHLDAPLFSPLTQAQPTLEIDLNFEPPDQSEWATLVRSIEPLLDGLKLSDLVENSTHQDISFLARELSKSTEAVMRVAVSARLEAAFKIPAPAFYAFLRQQVPAALPSPLLDASQNFTLDRRSGANVSAR